MIFPQLPITEFSKNDLEMLRNLTSEFKKHFNYRKVDIAYICLDMYPAWVNHTDIGDPDVHQEYQDFVGRLSTLIDEAMVLPAKDFYPKGFHELIQRYVSGNGIHEWHALTRMLETATCAQDIEDLKRDGRGYDLRRRIWDFYGMRHDVVNYTPYMSYRFAFLDDLISQIAQQFDDSV